MTVEEFLQGDYETGPGDGERREELRLIRTSHSSRSLSGTGYFLRWNRRGEFEH